jgi:uncharacterized protein YkwD
MASRPDPVALASELVPAYNPVRIRAGLGPLEVNEPLVAAARRHAGDMAARHRMAHRGSDGSSPLRRTARSGYRLTRAAENVAAGQVTTREVLSDWMASPGHRRNILGPYTEIGTGYATDASGTPYWCVTFGTPARPSGPTARGNVGYP